MDHEWAKAEKSIRGFAKRGECRLNDEGGVTSAATAELFAEFHEALVQNVVREFLPFCGLGIDFFSLLPEIGKNAGAAAISAVDGINPRVQTTQRAFGNAMACAAVILRGSNHN